MAVESDDDRAAFLDPDEFGVAVTWTREGVVQSPFDAVFSRPSTRIDGGEIPVIDRAAMLLCREADLPVGAAEDDPVSVSGETEAWLCRSIEPDGTGMARVILRLAQPFGDVQAEAAVQSVVDAVDGGMWSPPWPDQ